jgi:malate dehydrogenase (oxaloacetate-decarboxylating)
MGENESIYEESLKVHELNKGVLEVASKVSLDDVHDLSVDYTPGVAEPCRVIRANPDEVYTYTSKGNFVAVVTDGSAVLGLGDIGALASIPVMEGKSILFKTLGGVDAVPICLDTNDTEEIIKTVKHIAPFFGGINLEDISAPRCFEIEQRLDSELDIPVFHDDQHGTAIVVYAGLINALKLVGKDISNIRVVLNGAGAAGVAIALILIRAGVRDMVVCDSRGIIGQSRREGMNSTKYLLAGLTNMRGLMGGLDKAIQGADVFVGVSVGNVVSKEMVQNMAPDPIIFAMANPVPEIMPEDAIEAGAKVVATGRSDYPNQVNNVLGFPGIFRGALDTRANRINIEMKMAAANALAGIITESELDENHILPGPLDKRVVPAVASAVAKAAVLTGAAMIAPLPEEVARHAEKLVEHSRLHHAP